MWTAQAIYEELTRRDWTPMDLASRIGVTTPFLKGALAGDRIMPDDVAERIGKVLASNEETTQPRS